MKKSSFSKKNFISLSKDYSIIKSSITGNSMNPIIKKGALLKINLNQSQKYKRGDIALFLRNSQLIVHRIIKIRNPYFLAKGDNNRLFDKSLNVKAILGKVEEIIYPQYKINLKSSKNQFLKYFFTLYSILNYKFNFLLKVKNFSKLSSLKNIYRFLIKS